MKNIMFLLSLIFVAALFSCQVTKGTTNTKDRSDAFKSPNDIEYPDNAIGLVDHLRRVPGVQVEGDGPYARIRIRGVSSINSSNEPLFVLNGQPLTGGLSMAVQMVPVNEIKSIRVLKNPEDTSFYGVRGANGVIVITMK